MMLSAAPITAHETTDESAVYAEYNLQESTEDVAVIADVDLSGLAESSPAMADAVPEAGPEAVQASQIREPTFIYAKSTGKTTARISFEYRVNAGSYRVQYSSDNGASWSSSETVAQSTDGSNPVYRISNLTPNTTYIVRARALHKDSDSSHTNSDWAYSDSFTTDPKDPLPTPTITSHLVTTDSISISWGAISGAGSYNVKIATSQESLESVSPKNITGTSHTFNNLAAGTQYYVQVRAVPSDNTTTSISDSCVQSYTTRYDEYNEHDMAAVLAFLEKTSNHGIKNGKTLSSSYKASDPSTWEGITWTDGKKNKKIVEIDWNYAELAGTLDLSYCDALELFDCSNNQLTSLNVSGCTALEELDCSGNQLTSMNVSGCTSLDSLDCSGNQLTSMNVSGCTSLDSLDCSGNKLTSLNVSGCTVLDSLDCSGNNLTTLDVSSCAALTSLTCWNSGLTSVQLPVSCVTNGLEISFNDSMWVVTDGSGVQETLEDGDSYCVSEDTVFPLSAKCGSQTITLLAANQLATPTIKTISANATEDESTISVSWNAVSNASKYAVQYKLTTESEWNDCDDYVKSTSTTFEVWESGTYQVRVRALGTGNYVGSAFSASSNVFVPEVTEPEDDPEDEPEDDPTPGYASNECEQIREFLSRNGNGAKVSTSYSANDPTTWGVQWVEVEGIKHASVIDWTGKSLSGNADFSGFEYLTSLAISGESEENLGGLTSLNVSGCTALESLDCYYNQLTALDLSTNTNLKGLVCNDNQISSLNLTNNEALQWLDCQTNRLSSLNVARNTALKHLNCGFNQLTSLDVTQNVALTELFCNTNQISTLDVARNTALTTLRCWNENLTKVTLPKNAVDRLSVNLYWGNWSGWTFTNSKGTTALSTSAYVPTEIPFTATNNNGSQTISFSFSGSTPQQQQLASPTISSLTATGTTVSVAWSTVANASGYKLQYKESSASNWTSKSVSGTSTTFTGVAGKKYNVRVMALGSGNYTDSESSATRDVTLDDVPTTGKIQRVYSSNVSAMAGSEITVPVMYEAMDGKGSLTGLALRIHYDSSKLTYKSVENLLNSGRVGAVQVQNDSGNYDGDASTDKILVISWSDPEGNWPGSAEQLLMNLKFTVSEGISEATSIRFTAKSKAAGYSFQGDAVEVSPFKGNFDIDGDGQVDLLSDALMINRYLSDYTGTALTNMAISENATRQDPQEITDYLDSICSLLDIDGNGEVDLLTDGILLNRYMSDYSGDALTNMAIGEGATRSDAKSISEYIAMLIPTAPQAVTSVVTCFPMSAEMETPALKAEPEVNEVPMTAPKATAASVSTQTQATDSVFDHWDDLFQDDEDEDDDWDFNPVLKSGLKK